MQPYEDGFLLSEVPLGEGFLDIRAWSAPPEEEPEHPARPGDDHARSAKIPIFTDKYWATFDDTYSPLPGRDLARVVRS